VPVAGGRPFVAALVAAALLLAGCAAATATPVSIPPEATGEIGPADSGAVQESPALEPTATFPLSLPDDQGTRDPNHHRAILALSTAFWDSYLRGDAAARAWLDGSGARSVLEKADRWLHK
jgi:hypothetical protein